MNYSTTELKMELEKRFPWLNDGDKLTTREAWELRAILTFDDLIKWHRELANA